MGNGKENKTMILICFGTRPEYIKVKPLIDKLKNKIPFRILFTGQHKDLIKDLDGIDQIEILDGSNRLDSIVVSILNKESLFKDVKYVLVQGDTTSAFSVSLAAFHRKIKIMHLEAGLRTYNKEHPFPEEFNRRSISAMADYHFCPTQHTVDNLVKEGITKNVHLVGNTVLDNLINLVPTYENKILITLHRRENHSIMDEWFKLIEELAEEYSEYEFKFPIHPNPEVRKHKHLLKNVKVVEPIDYSKFIKELATCKFILTDSGGIQEEATFLKKKCLVLRDTTERPEALGNFSTLVNTNNLKYHFKHVMQEYIPEAPSPFGDGKASEKIFSIIKEEMYNEIERV